MFRVVLRSIIRSAYNCIYSIWYLSQRYCYRHTQTGSNSSTIEADSGNGVTNTRRCRYAPDDGWKYHPKHVEQFPDINKLCNVASCWIYNGILLVAHYILHISRIRVKGCPLLLTLKSNRILSFLSLPYERFVATSKVSYPHSPIWCLLFQLPVTSRFLTIFQ